jgi:hypothetical protein
VPTRADAWAVRRYEAEERGAEQLGNSVNEGEDELGFWSVSHVRGTDGRHPPTLVLAPDNQRAEAGDAAQRVLG